MQVELREPDFLVARSEVGVVLVEKRLAEHHELVFRLSQVEEARRRVRVLHRKAPRPEQSAVDGQCSALDEQLDVRERDRSVVGCVAQAHEQLALVLHGAVQAVVRGDEARDISHNAARESEVEELRVQVRIKRDRRHGLVLLELLPFSVAALKSVLPRSEVDLLSHPLRRCR